MNQDEPIKPDEADADDEISNVDADAPTDSEPAETAVEESPTPVEAQSNATQSGGGMKWLMRTGVQAATVVIVAGLVFFLLGVAQRTKWLTADGFSGGNDEAVAETVLREVKLAAVVEPREQFFVERVELLFRHVSWVIAKGEQR